jgi:hypothetical protein
MVCECTSAPREMLRKLSMTPDGRWRNDELRQHATANLVSETKPLYLTREASLRSCICSWKGKFPLQQGPSGIGAP